MRRILIGALAVAYAFARSGFCAEPPSVGIVTNPSLISSVASIWQSGTYGAPPSVKGAVRQVTWEKYQLHSNREQTSLSAVERIEIKYDDDQHEVERIEGHPSEKGACTAKSTWRTGHIETQEHSCSGSRGITNAWTRHWTYDPAGRVIEYHEHSDYAEPRYFYHYDEKGRISGWDYKQWGDDLFNRGKVQYSADKVEADTYDKDGHEIASQVQTVNGDGKIIDLSKYELSGGKMKLWYHSNFKYDQAGRLIEQKTDPYTQGVGADNAPLPGRVVVHYEQNLVEEWSYDLTGRLADHRLAHVDEFGIPVSFENFGSSGKPQPGSDFLPDEKTGKTELREGDLTWKVTCDEHGNWTERQGWFTRANGGPSILLRTVRQMIVYR